MNKNNMSDIFADRICERAKIKMKIYEELNDRIQKSKEKRKEIIEKKNSEIRKYLLNGICPDCGGDIRKRITYSLINWCVDFMFPYYSHVMCICKECGAKKGLTYFNT